MFFGVNVGVGTIRGVSRCIERGGWVTSRCHCKGRGALGLQVRGVRGSKRIRTMGGDGGRTARLLPVRIWRELRLDRIRVKLGRRIRNIPTNMDRTCSGVNVDMKEGTEGTFEGENCG